MALTGQLSDMSLAELIEFFCNQRKTGRLKIDYPRGHSVFFIKDGELVDAKVGALSGAEAVYFSLTLPNAAFDFSPEVLPTRQTIFEPWTQVVLEGLRRLDEGLAPTEADAFGNGSPTDADVALLMDQVERLGESVAREEASGAAASAAASERSVEKDVPLSLTVDGAGGGGKKKWMVAASVAVVVMACAVVAIPLGLFSGSKRAPKQQAAPAAAQSSDAAASQQASGAQATEAPTAEPASEAAPVEEAAPGEVSAEEAAAWAARREREERERRERRERERRAAEEARKAEQALKPADAAAAAGTPAAASGPKSVRVSVTYDEAGRVVQASVAGATPGAEAYGGTAVRIARGKRFPAGKAGSTVITIPVN